MQKKVLIKWSPSFGYIIGIITTDGNLSKDERHIVITSKDKILLDDIKNFLLLDTKVGSKSRGGEVGQRKYFVLQIGDKNFYNFLLSIGLTQNKSNTIGKIILPKKYFSHFLSGCNDGDGNIDVYKHKESLHKQLRIRLASASNDFLSWISNEIQIHLKISGGWIYSQKNKSTSVLCYGKKDSIKILNFIYKDKNLCLNRKFILAEEFLKK